jgi:hypothetical protein
MSGISEKWGIWAMMILVEWDNEEKTVVRWTFSGDWTWDDFRAAQAQMHEMIRCLDYKVDVLADLRAAPSVPNDAFRNFKNAEARALPNRDRVVLVSNNLLVRGMAACFNEVFRNRPTVFLFASTLDEGRVLLAQPRPAQRKNVPGEPPETFVEAGPTHRS